MRSVMTAHYLPPLPAHIDTVYCELIGEVPESFDGGIVFPTRTGLGVALNESLLDPARDEYGGSAP